MEQFATAPTILDEFLNSNNDFLKDICNIEDFFSEDPSSVFDLIDQQITDYKQLQLNKQTYDNAGEVANLHSTPKEQQVSDNCSINQQPQDDSVVNLLANSAMGIFELELQRMEKLNFAAHSPEFMVEIDKVSIAI